MESRCKPISNSIKVDSIISGRALSYAVDGKVTVDRKQRGAECDRQSSHRARGDAVDRLARQITTYRLKAAGDGEHRLLIEHPRPAGWSLATPDPTYVELTADAYRIPATLTGSRQSNVAVTMERQL